MTLTDTQARILRAMRDGAELKEERWGNGFWLFAPGSYAGNKVNRRVFDALKDKKLTSAQSQNGGYILYTLTPAGAEALAQWEAGR